MRYANTPKSHKGVGVEPLCGTLAGDAKVLVCDSEHRAEIHIHDKAQLQEVINLLRHASIINGWGAVK